MGIRIELEDGEPIATAYKRFRKLILAEGAFPLHHCRWHKKRLDYFIKPTTLRRRRRWLDRVAKRGCLLYGAEPESDWFDDLCHRPRRAMGRLGPHVAT